MSRPFIPAAPSLGIRDVLGSAQEGLFPALDDGNTQFYSRGSDAIRVLFEGMALQADESVLAPAYLCAEVVGAFRAAGVRPEWYAVDERGEVDPDDIARRIHPGTRAIYVVHYFGFPQDVARLRAVADAAGVFLIEDCAHALFGHAGGRPLGSVGDAAIFSLRKSLPLPDGGALVTQPHLRVHPVVAQPRGMTTLAGLARLAVKGVCFQVQWRPPVGGAATSAADRSLDATAPAGPITAMSSRARRIYSATDVHAFATRRRANYNFYLARLGERAVFPVLPDGVVPFSFPLLHDDRDRVAAAMAQRGLVLNMGFPEAPVLDGVPAEEADLRGARSLAERVLELPVHQDLRPSHLEQILAEFNRVA
jgi:dTDP-4-amino-4,6-dideoxygalactose transaminase